MFRTVTDPCDKNSLIADELFRESASCQESEFWSEPDSWEPAELDEFTVGLMAFELRDYTAAASELMCVGDDDRAKFALAQEWLGTTRLKAGRSELAIEPLRLAVRSHCSRPKMPTTA